MLTLTVYPGRRRSGEGFPRQEILRRYPEDGIARLHLARLAGLRQQPPPPDWDGAVALEKL